MWVDKINKLAEGKHGSDFSKKDLDIIFKIFYPKIRNKIWSMIYDKSRVDDLTQDAILHLFNKIDKYDCTKSKFTTWAFTVFTRKAVSSEHYRLNSKKLINSESINSPNFHFLEDVIDDPIIDINIYKEINDVEDPIIRELLILKYIDNLTVDKISKLVNINPNTIKTKLRKGRILIQEKNKHIWTK